MVWKGRHIADGLIIYAVTVALLTGCQTNQKRPSVDEILQQMTELRPAGTEGAVVCAADRIASNTAGTGKRPSLIKVSTGDACPVPTAQSARDSDGEENAISSGGSSIRLVAATAPLPEPPTPQLAEQGPYVNDVFLETDVREAIQMMAVQANVSVVLDEQLGGVTTAVIENEPFEAALRRVLLPVGGVFRKHQGQYLVGVADPKSSMFPLIAERLDYQTQHLSPTELVALIPERLAKYVQVMDKRSRIIVEAPEEIAQQIAAELQRSDQPVPQVVLEVLVCVFSPEARFRWGMNFQHGVQHPGGVLRNFQLHDLAFSGAMTPVALGGMFTDFAVTSHFLQLLAQEGYVKIRAAPRVMAKDGEKAQISIARETYFSVQPVATEFLYRQDIERVEAGISLEILPTIRGDNVTVTIERAEVSEDVRAAGTGPELASPYPLINRRKVTTTVHVKDGQTIVIGGLTHTQIVDQVNKIPVLGDLPGVGFLFRRVDTQEQEAEVVIFISPQIVTAPESELEALPAVAAEPLTASETSHSRENFR